MTGGYRDDHDAALARIDALEQDLEVARKERDRAKVELAELKQPLRPPAAPQPVGAPHALIAGLVMVALAIVVVVVVAQLKNGGWRGSQTHHERVAFPIPTGSSAPVVETPPVAATPDETSRLIDEAVARAGQKALWKIEISMIDQSGKVHAEFGGDLTVRFFQQHPVAPPPDRPIGAPEVEVKDDGYDCLELTRRDNAWSELEGESCKFSVIPTPYKQAKLPTCTPTAIWKLALRDGATAGALARIWYDGTWYFEIRDRRAPFDRAYADNCTR